MAYGKTFEKKSLHFFDKNNIFVKWSTKSKKDINKDEVTVTFREFSIDAILNICVISTRCKALFLGKSLYCLKIWNSILYYMARFAFQNACSFSPFFHDFYQKMFSIIFQSGTTHFCWTYMRTYQRSNYTYAFYYFLNELRITYNRLFILSQDE